MFRNSRSGSFQKTIRCLLLVEDAVEGVVDLLGVHRRSRHGDTTEGIDSCRA